MSSEWELDDGIKSIKSAWRREHTARANLEKILEQAEAENAKLRELCETFGMIANDAVCDYYERDEMLAQANADARKLGVEL